MWDLIVSVPDHCLFFYFTSPDIRLKYPERVKIAENLVLYTRIRLSVRQTKKYVVHQVQIRRHIYRFRNAFPSYHALFSVIYIVDIRTKAHVKTQHEKSFKIYIYTWGTKIVFTWWHYQWHHSCKIQHLKQHCLLYHSLCNRCCLLSFIISENKIFGHIMKLCCNFLGTSYVWTKNMAA